MENLEYLRTKVHEPKGLKIRFLAWRLGLYEPTSVNQHSTPPSSEENIYPLTNGKSEMGIVLSSPAQPENETNFEAIYNQSSPHSENEQSLIAPMTKWDKAMVGGAIAVSMAAILAANGAF